MDERTVFLPDVVADDRTEFARDDQGWAHPSGYGEPDFTGESGPSMDMWLNKPFVHVENRDRALGRNVLADAAQPLFNHLQILLEGGALKQPRATLKDDIELFERAVHECGIEWPRIRLARYVLCTFADEVLCVQGLTRSGEETLLFHFHRETWGGEGVFWALRRCCVQAADHWMEIELIYFCLTMGFQGQFRREKNGLQQVERLRTMLWGVLQRLGRAAAPNPLARIPPMAPVRVSRSQVLLPILFMVILVLSAGVVFVSRADTESEVNALAARLSALNQTLGEAAK